MEDKTSQPTDSADSSSKTVDEPQNLKEDGPSPSAFLTQALEQYCHELEALRNSLIQVMMLFRLLNEKGTEEIENFIDTHGKDKTEEGTENNKTLKFTLDADKQSQFNQLKRKKDNSESASRLMPRNFIVALICCYDSFLGKILRYVFTVRPEILDSSDRTLKYSDLLEFADIPAAREYLIEKEVESVLRKSHVEHFNWLEKKLSTPFNKNLRSWPQFVELTERRNLFVHTDGVISSQYIQVCNEHKCSLIEGASVGKRLGAPSKYFTESFQCLYEIGFKLAHVIWRKLQKDEIALIDRSLVKHTFDLISAGEYEISARILEFFTQSQMPHEDESTSRMLTINLAQSYKWQENETKCKDVLNRFDWSASEDRFKLGVATLKEEYDTVFPIMRRLRHDETFHKAYYKDWPLFQKLRTQDGFSAVYEECYNEKFIISEEVTEPLPETEDQDLDSAIHSPDNNLSGEQVGAEQPATRSESKSEDDDKPQPESEGRSR